MTVHTCCRCNSRHRTVQSTPVHIVNRYSYYHTAARRNWRHSHYLCTTTRSRPSMKGHSRGRTELRRRCPCTRSHISIRGSHAHICQRCSQAHTRSHYSLNRSSHLCTVDRNADPRSIDCTEKYHTVVHTVMPLNKQCDNGSGQLQTVCNIYVRACVCMCVCV